MDKYTSTHPKSLPSAEELRAALAASGSSSAREAIAALYDADTFVETGAYVKRGFAEYLADDKTSALESVITGYGAVDGKLVFTYAFDFTRNKGAVDEKTAAKIVSLYEIATKNGAPVVAILDSAGADVFEGVSALAAYARILRAAASASGGSLAATLLLPAIRFSSWRMGPYSVRDRTSSPKTSSVSKYMQYPTVSPASCSRKPLAWAEA